MKWFSIIGLFALIVMTIIEDGYFRHIGNKREVYGLFVEDASIAKLTVDTQDILNDESVRKLARRTANRLMNYRPGQASDHVSEPEFAKGFISENAYQDFSDRFLYWSDREFRVNNISIKESIVTNEKLLPVPMTNGMRMWAYSASLPVVNRGVGGTGKTIMSIRMKILYAGPEVGIGLYDIQLYNR